MRLRLHLHLLMLVRDREWELLRDLVLLVLLSWGARRSTHLLLWKPGALSWRRHHLLAIYLNLILVALVLILIGLIIVSLLVLPLASTSLVLATTLHVLEVVPVLTLPGWASLWSIVVGIATTSVERSLARSVLRRRLRNSIVTEI
jgi:uncharacterized SAM-binding protein YcdF (DUF218 family)